MQGEEKTEVTQNGQISDNKKENPLKIKGFSYIPSMRKRRLELPQDKTPTRT